MQELESDSAFTLVEILLSTVFLGLMISGLTMLYFSGFQSLNAQGEDALFDSALRSRMEWIMAQKFDALVDGSDTVTIGGVSYPVTWTVVPVDLDGDTIDEPTAVEVRLSGMDRKLKTLIVDHEGLVGKIP